MDTTEQNGNGSAENPVSQQSEELTQVVKPLRIVAPTGDSEVKKTRGLYKWLFPMLLILLFLGLLTAGFFEINSRVNDLEKDITGLKTDKADKTELAKKVDQTAFNKLKESVDKVVSSDEKQNEELKDLKARADKNEADIADLGNNKASKTDVATTHWRITRVEKKLAETRIVATKNPTPMPTEEKTSAPAAPQPTHNRIYRPVPVYIDVYKPRSAR